MKKSVEIEGRGIGGDHPVYVIAELGGNFQDYATAVRLVDLAKQAGVDAVKLQHYRAETIASKKALFDMPYTGVVPQYELFKKYELGEELTAAVVAHCRRQRVTVLSTPSHPTDVDRLERHGLPAYKIGSDDAANLPLIRHVARLGKPVLLSTGMCTMTEVQEAVDAMLEEGNDRIVLLHCVSNYPAPPEAVNLRAMTAMSERFACPVGYSDHTLGIDACHAAAVLGAAVLEFHLTHDKSAAGPDHRLSKDFGEAAALVAKVRALPLLLGDGVKRPAASEVATMRNNRKSLVLTAAVRAGEKITPMNVAIRRPGSGIPCRHYYTVLGKTAARDLAADDPLAWDDLW